jgi:hypothetical protein
MAALENETLAHMGQGYSTAAIRAGACGKALVEQLSESREGLVDLERKTEAVAGLE